MSINLSNNAPAVNELLNLKRKVTAYKEVIANIQSYREIWHASLKEEIVDQLKKLSEATELGAEVSTKCDLENLEAVVLSLGDIKSGMSKKVNNSISRDLIKHNGSLIYQQLFNGKVIVLINYPAIENYGQPRPPKTIGIYRPEEIQPPFFIRHLEEFMREVTNWEDYDDDEPHKKIGFNLNFEKTGGLS